MRLLSLLTAGLLLAGCTQQPTQRQAPTIPAQPLPAPAPVAAVARPALALADTVPPYTALEPYAWRGEQQVPVSPLVRIDGLSYRVEASAAPDSTRPLRYTYPPEAGEVNLGDPAPGLDDRTVQGVEVTYTFRLLRADGQPQFTRRILKSSLKKEMTEDLAACAVARQPAFLGYLPQFGALAFELDLTPPDSDAGGQLLLLLDARTGQLRQQRLSSWTGGCNSPVALSEDGRTLLTSFHIIRADGRVTPFEKPGLQVGGTLLVNNQHVLVSYLPDYDPQGNATAGASARLLDLTGRQLASFPLENVIGELGTRMQAAYLGQTRTYYLFDEEHQQIGLLPHDQPRALRLLKLAQLATFQPPQRATEVRFSVNTESGAQGAFYVDTLSQALRYRLQKPD
ncbi:hypothetical protein Q5H93_12100 [Hymenobacter sp. ASUV-10]|uniref:Lipoprotein n=1 Tax=Hymenobacter aranciens TaxID=3063996 RepID=A0ABT9BB21_9BACT|nr:hypothetical protein [Hymenobacter sp. ASUV-10]MDO7875476.1 hypothetical protein [Hymenobacter sp. ASUV-10]